eukprot:scaffold241_cov340-Pavlova_lutheri.AAC.3
MQDHAFKRIDPTELVHPVFDVSLASFGWYAFQIDLIVLWSAWDVHPPVSSPFGNPPLHVLVTKA